MRQLVVGLGNPGEEYQKSRHNVGYFFVDLFSKRNVPGVVAKKTGSFMNASGLTVAKLLSFYKLDPRDLYIVHDDLDIPLGQYKIQFGVGPKDHKGILDIEEKLGTKDFWRVRVGVDNRDLEKRIPGEEYVLQNFNKEEMVVLQKTLDNLVLELVKCFDE